MHHCYIGLPQHHIPLCHNGTTACFFGAICGIKPITSLTHASDIVDAIRRHGVHAQAIGL
jgi:phage portal protein BeeE